MNEITDCKMAECSQYVKHPQGKPLNSGEKRIILNVFHKFSEKYPTMVIKDVTKLTSEFTGVSVNSINAAHSEISRMGKLTTPANKKKCKKPVLELENDEFVRSAVRRKVHQFYVNNEPPTVSKVLLAVNSDSDLPSFKRTSFYTLLCDIGFQYVK